MDLSVFFFIFCVICSSANGFISSYNTASKIVEGKLNVHLVPHSHDDVGWLKTVDQYFVGSNSTIQVIPFFNYYFPLLVLYMDSFFLICESSTHFIHSFLLVWRAQGACVENTLDSVIMSLMRNPNRKFIFAEMVTFFILFLLFFFIFSHLTLSYLDIL